MMDKAIHSHGQRPALEHLLATPGADLLETHARLARATTVLVHRIGDDDNGNDALGAATAPQRPRVAQAQAHARAHTQAQTQSADRGQTKDETYEGTITPPRIRDVRPPYRPPVMLRQASLRAREVQPPLLNMGTATGSQHDEREGGANGWRER
ncbi:hypothetical protein [Bordetella sp. LUAb4]|uniref:hypothetical protein n=1 Tax=Bordetella sp. LUAb4 TaxID=2843195 RepID=UPI001E3EEDCE|nr:hypothetical protein [Bordetella sp. LUAb4]